MSLEKNKWVKGFRKTLSVERDKTLRTMLLIETFLVLDSQQRGYDPDLYRTLLDHIIEYWKAHDEIDTVGIVHVEPPR